MCLCFGNGEPLLNGYIHSDMTCDVDVRKSISRFLMTWGLSLGNPSCRKGFFFKCRVASRRKGENKGLVRERKKGLGFNLW